jgi:hypothetical protein
MDRNSEIIGKENIEYMAKRGLRQSHSRLCSNRRLWSTGNPPVMLVREGLTIRP